VSGDRPPIVLIADGSSVANAAITALATFPAEPPWVLIGGLAVFLRLGTVHRPTADADTIARSQAQLLATLSDRGLATVVTGGNVEVSLPVGNVDVDVMELADDPLPDDAERRAFALARRAALESRSIERIVVRAASGAVLVEADLPVATVAALVCLKTVSMVRRPHGRHPVKVGSDIHDLVRLVQVQGARRIAEELAGYDAELSRWVGEHVANAFGRDLRYTLLRLRRNDRSASAQALRDDQVAAVGVLAEELVRADGA
jgi:hypothetical protein